MKTNTLSWTCTRLLFLFSAFFLFQADCESQVTEFDSLFSMFQKTEFDMGNDSLFETCKAAYSAIGETSDLHKSVEIANALAYMYVARDKIELAEKLNAKTKSILERNKSKLHLRANFHEWVYDIYELDYWLHSAGYDLASKLSVLGVLKLQIEQLPNDTANLYRTYSYYGHISGAFLENNQYDTVIHLLNNAFKELESYSFSNKFEEANLLNKVGLAHEKLGNFSWATAYYQRYHDILVELDASQENLAVSLYNLGYMYYERGQVDTALSMFEQALKYNLKVNSSSTQVADIYNTIGLVYTWKKQGDKAIDYFQRCLNMQLDLLGEDHARNAIVHVNLADEYYTKKWHFKALNELKKAENIYLQHANEIELSPVYQLYSIIYADQKNEKKALQHATAAINIDKTHRGDDNFLTAEAYANLGEVYKRLGRPEAAYKNAMTALEIMLEQAPASNLSVVETVKLALEFCDKNSPEYFSLIQTLIDGCVKDGYLPMPTQKPEIENILFPERLLAAIHLLAKYEGVNQKHDVANRWFNYGYQLASHVRRQIIFGDDRIQIGERLTQFYESYIHFKYELYRVDNSIPIARDIIQAMESAKSMLLEELHWIKREDLSNPTFLKLRKINRELSQKKAEWTLLTNQQSTNSKDLIEELNNRIFKLTREYDRLYANLPTELTKYKESTFDYQRIQRKLNPDETILQYYLIGDSLLIIGALNKSALKFRHSKSKQPISSLIFEYRTHLQAREQEKVTAASKKLYDLCLAPVNTFSKSGSLIVIPQASLFLIPFQALMDENDKFQIEHSRISYHVSASMWLENRLHPKASGHCEAQVWAPIEFDINALLPLPFSEIEAYKVVEIMNAKVLLRKHASEKSFNEMAQEAGILHFATHAVMNDVVSANTYIVLNSDSDSNSYDGKLYLHEITQMNLNANLVFINACNSGIGKVYKSEGVIGLPRAFLMAGVPTVVGSYWQISDAASAELVASFYTQLKKGKTAEEAMQLAQLEFINNKDIAKKDPYQWSSFAVIGDGSMLYQKEKSNDILILVFGIAITILLLRGIYKLQKR